jgi:hypothetical protein
VGIEGIGWSVVDCFMWLRRGTDGGELWQRDEISFFKKCGNSVSCGPANYWRRCLLRGVSDGLCVLVFWVHEVICGHTQLEPLTGLDFVFRRIRKFAERALRHVCLSVWNDSAPTGRIFLKLYMWRFLKNLFEEIQLSLKCDDNNGYVTWRPTYIFENISLISS